MLLNFHETYFFRSFSLSIFIRLLYRPAFRAKSFLHCKGSPFNFHCPHSFDIFPLSSFQLSSSRLLGFSSRLIAPFVVSLFKIFTSPFPFSSLLISKSREIIERNIFLFNNRNI